MRSSRSATLSLTLSIITIMSDGTNPAPPSTAVDPAELHRQQEARLADIEQRIKAEQPLTSDIQSLSSCLEPLYQDNHASLFIPQLRLLQQTYDKIRLVRGDGNCFYRAFLYSLAEQLLLSGKDGRDAFVKDTLTTNWQNSILTLDGYDELTLEIFFETTRDFIADLSTAEILHDDLSQENAVSDYATWFLRLVAAAHLKHHVSQYVPFLGVELVDDEAYQAQVMTQFCATKVEPMGCECEDVQIMALAEALQCQVFIEYLDGHSATQVTQHVFGPQTAIYKIHLLYRPGHYDVLYHKEETK